MRGALSVGDAKSRYDIQRKADRKRTWSEGLSPAATTRIMSSRSECNQPEAPELAFITISDQESIKNPAHQQLARTQAIKHSLQRKRRQLQLTASNFVDETPDTIGRRRKRSVKENHKSVVEPPSCSTTLGASVINPFQTLTVDANRLTELLRHRSARHAAKPVSSVDDALDYQGLYNIFHSGLEDPALTAALCLTLALSANGGVMDGECSAYRLKCIRHINEKLSDPAQAASTTTVGAILLLVGVEVGFFACPANLGTTKLIRFLIGQTRRAGYCTNPSRWDEAASAGL